MADKLQVGDMAPDFALAGVLGEKSRIYSLSDYQGKQGVLVFFYVFDWTPI